MSQPEKPHFPPHRERRMATHVREAVLGPMQAKSAGPRPGSKQLAPHVQAAIAAGRGVGLQKKTEKVREVSGRQPAPHVRNAIEGMRQTGVQDARASRQQVSPHLQRALSSAAAPCAQPAASIKEIDSPEPPEYLYHGTDSTKLRSIKSSGLLVNRAGTGSTIRAYTSGGRKPTKVDFHYLFMGDYDYAADYARSLPTGAVLRISTDQLKTELLSFHGSEWRYAGDVPVEALCFLAGNGDYPSLQNWTGDEHAEGDDIPEPDW